MSLPETLYHIADELRAIACLGLRFAENAYAVERYERVLEASARIIAALEQRAPDEVLPQLQDNLLHVSPLAGAEAAVLRGGKLLLIQRADNSLWALPGGLVDVGETLAEAALRELREETGLQGQVTRLLGMFDSRLWKSRFKAQLYHVIFQVEAGSGPPAPSLEATAVAFFGPDDLPPLSPGHHLRVPFLFKLVRGEIPVPYFDPVEEERT